MLEFLESQLTPINGISWIGCALLLWGLRMIGDKKRLGFFVASAGEVLWIVWGFLTGAHALIAMSLAILYMYIRAIWLWQKDASK